MAKGLIAGSANVDFFDPSSNALMASSKTLIDSGLNMAITGEEARGGQGNILLGKYYHDSSFGLTLTDQIWDLQYLAMNCGGAIEAGSDIITMEQHTVEEGGKITLTQTPVAFTATSGVIGWYKLSSEADDAYKLIEIDAQTKTATLVGVAEGSVVCVKYVIRSNSARKFVVNADYIPSIVHAVMTISLFKAGTTTETLTSSAKIGEIIVDIPNFQLEGAQDFSLTSSGIASVALSGSALATFSGNAGCSDHGYYAIITENIFGQSEWANVSALVVANGNIDLAVDEKATLQVYKMFNNGTQPALVDNADLTFTVVSGTDTYIEVEDGVVTAKAEGKDVVEITVTDPAISLTTACAVEVIA